MGLLLRDVLRRLCVEGGWSYAVFWRMVGCGNSRYLLWEEGHHEPSRASFFGLPGCHSEDSALEEWGVRQQNCDDGYEGNFPQGEKRVGVLVENIMKPQIHPIGCGMVGRTAFSGKHQWILQNELGTEGYTSHYQDLEEIKDQLNAGIQTIAVVSVLPHGVIQLGSLQMIMQDVGFVNHVKGLFMQLACVAGALLSGSNLRTSGHKVQAHTASVTEESVNTYALLTGVTGFTRDSCSYKDINIQPSSSFTEPPCSSLSDVSAKRSPTFFNAHINSKSIFTMMPECFNDILQQKDHTVAMPVNSFSVKREDQSDDTRVFSSVDVNMVINQQSNLHVPNSGGQSQPSIATSRLNSTNLTFLEQQLLVGLEPHLSEPTSCSSENFHIGYWNPGPSYSRVSSTGVLPGRNEPSPEATSVDPGKFSLPAGSIVTKDTVGVRNISSSDIATCRMSTDAKFSNSNYQSSKDDTLIIAATANKDVVLTVSTSDKRKIETDMFQSMGNPSTSSNSCVSRTFSGYDCFLRSDDHDQGIKKCQDDVDISDRKSTLLMSTEKCIPVQTMSKTGSGLSIVNPSGNDLYDVLGLDNIPRQSDCNFDALFASMIDTSGWESSTDVSTCATQMDTDSLVDASHCGISCSEVFLDSRQDQLLDAVISKVNSSSIQSSDDDISCKTTLTNIFSSIHDIPANHCQMASSGKMSIGTYPAMETEIPFGSCSLDKSGDSSHSDGVYKSQISLWVENNQNMKNDSTSMSNCKRVDETGKLYRKKPKAGENPRPRPKDRQMIQDRVKELRELVPNGAKCSIDALLERTIKHMLFLQSVTKHADKLKDTGEPKIINERGLLMKDNFEGGATWAFEVGSQSMICPIVVEDLNPSCQLLVEMLCEDRGFFLEIADLIKALGLTILKGVMEARNEKVWARFAVEANKDVARMDIFLSLIRLLEPTAVTSMSPQVLDNMNMAHNMFCQS